MSYACPLPLTKTAMDLAGHLEGAVRRFSRFHKTPWTAPRQPVLE